MRARNYRLRRLMRMNRLWEDCRQSGDWHKTSVEEHWSCEVGMALGFWTTSEALSHARLPVLIYATDTEYRLRNMLACDPYVRRAECNPGIRVGHLEIARTATSEQLPGTAFSTVVVSRAWK
jgi:hypothetical protein